MDIKMFVFLNLPITYSFIHFYLLNPYSYIHFELIFKYFKHTEKIQRKYDTMQPILIFNKCQHFAIFVSDPCFMKETKYCRLLAPIFSLTCWALYPLRFVGTSENIPEDRLALKERGGKAPNRAIACVASVYQEGKWAERGQQCNSFHLSSSRLKILSQKK